MKNSGLRMKRRSFFQAGMAGLAGIQALSNPLAALGKNQAASSKKAKKNIGSKLGKTGVTLPVVSMGVMNADNGALVQAALDSGIVHLDTARFYQGGRNEEMIGRIIKGRPRDSYFIATKVPGLPRDNKTGLFSAETKGEDFLRLFDVSLQRLGIDYVDILYLHNVLYRESVLFEPLLEALRKAKESGKARFVGVSTHGNEPEVIRSAIESQFYDVVLTAYNFRQDYIPKLNQAISDAVKAGIGIIAMKTLAGAYWDKEKTKPINAKAALKWALNNPDITTAIPGFTTFDQMELDLSVMEDLTLTEEEKKDLQIKTTGAGLYCQTCSRCLSQCPNSLPIPSLMRSYMYAYGYRNLIAAQEVIASLGLADAPCQGCESCSVQCAFGYRVKQRVMDIARLKNVPADFIA